MDERQITLKLAAETGASIATVAKWLRDSESVTRVHAYAFSAAVEVLDIAHHVADVRRDLQDQARTGTEG